MSDVSVKGEHAPSVCFFAGVRMEETRIWDGEDGIRRLTHNNRYGYWTRPPAIRIMAAVKDYLRPCRGVPSPRTQLWVSAKCSVDRSCIT